MLLSPIVSHVVVSCCCFKLLLSNHVIVAAVVVVIATRVVETHCSKRGARFWDEGLAGGPDPRGFFLLACRHSSGGNRGHL